MCYCRNLMLGKLFCNSDTSQSNLRKPSDFVPALTPALQLFINQCDHDLVEYFQQNDRDKYYNLTHEQRLALVKLCGYTDITIKMADKGGSVVILDSDWYANKLKLLLSDTVTYHIINPIDVKRTIDRVHSKLCCLSHRLLFTPQQLEFLYIDKPTTPIFKALPKVHKSLTDPPLRPIVSGRGWVTENISIWLEVFLKPYVASMKHILVDTGHFLTLIGSIKQEELLGDYLMVTLDINNLFTVINNEYGLEAIKTLLTTLELTHNRIELVVELLTLVLENNIFQGIDGEELLCFWVTAERLFNIDRSSHTRRDQYQSLLRVLSATYLQEGSIVSSTCKIAHETLEEFANWENALKKRIELLRLSKTLEEFANWENALKKRIELLRQIQHKALHKLQTYWIPCFLTHSKITLEKLEEESHILKSCLVRLNSESVEKNQAEDDVTLVVLPVQIKQSLHAPEQYSTRHTKRLLWCSAEGYNDKHPVLRSQTGRDSWKATYKENCDSSKQLKSNYATDGKVKRSISSQNSTPRACTTLSHNSNSKSKHVSNIKSLNSNTEKPLPPVVGKKVPKNGSYVKIPGKTLSIYSPPVKSCSLQQIENYPLIPHQLDYLQLVLRADSFAGGPFENFLHKKGCILELHYLGLWRVMDTFLSIAVLSSRDREGNILRQILAEKILETYLLETSKCHIPLQENTVRHLEALLPSDEALAWLRKAEGEICQVLYTHFDQFLHEEDTTFLDLVTHTKIDGSHERQGRKSSWNDYKVPSQQVWRIKEALILGWACSTIEKVDSLTEKQWKQLIMVDLGNGGSVQMAPEPVVNPTDYKSMSFDELASKYPKIAVEKLSVNYQLYCQRIPHAERPAEKEDQNRAQWKKVDLRFIRKGNTVLQRPTSKPRSLMEILRSSLHVEFFKRFLRAQDAEAPLLFWLAVEKLSMVDEDRFQKSHIKRIMGNFFSKNTNPNELLHCEAGIIKDIAKTPLPTVNMFLLAQAHVFKAMDDKWFKMYQDTFTGTPETVESESALTMRKGSILQSKRSHWGARSYPGTESVQSRESYPRWCSRPSQDALTHTLFHMQRTHLRAIWRKRGWSIFIAFIRSVCKFQKSMLDLTIRREFEDFLRKEVHNDFENTAIPRATSTVHSATGTSRQQSSSLGSRSVDSGENLDMPQLKRRLINNRVVIVNHLVDDLCFYLETDRYTKMCDSAIIMSSAGLYREDDEALLRNKVNMIINLFLNSEIPPKLRVNISEVQKVLIMALAEDGNYNRALFHSALMSIFPVLIYFWRRFCIHNIMKSFHGWKKVQEKKKIAIPDYRRLNLDKQWYRKVNFYTSEDFIILRFTLSAGIQLLIPHHRERIKDLSPTVPVSNSSFSVERYRGSFSSSPALSCFQQQLSLPPLASDKNCVEQLGTPAVTSKNEI
ncbi:regulator of G-protein signaling protein-like [Protopterus annectens]|uniref:regulator of G-protein signaling protein-like n=1 Tax=Protopterus annectens TaxID=7888 RepID=UPI001CFB0633|nr:regulator of G-protein signaling protein-like [Protopterus annectens]